MPDDPSPVPSRKRIKFLQQATDTYAKNIRHPELVDFLEYRRIPLHWAHRWQIGYVEQALPGHEPYARRVAIPYRTPAGVVSMAFRCLHHTGDPQCLHAKYLAETGSRPLFGVHNLSNGLDKIYITEGELDCVVATECGLPAVAFPGAARNWQQRWNYLFNGYSEVIVLPDGDDAGRGLGKRICDNLRNARMVAMPDGEDVSSFVAAYGADALKSLVRDLDD